jgi:hypothetical protein
MGDMMGRSEIFPLLMAMTKMAVLATQWRLVEISLGSSALRRQLKKKKIFSMAKSKLPHKPR